MIYPINMSSAIITSILSACIYIYTQSTCSLLYVPRQFPAFLHLPNSSLLACSYHSQAYGGTTLGLDQIHSLEPSPWIARKIPIPFTLPSLFVSVNSWTKNNVTGFHLFQITVLWRESSMSFLIEFRRNCKAEAAVKLQFKWN